MFLGTDDHESRCMPAFGDVTQWLHVLVGRLKPRRVECLQRVKARAEEVELGICAGVVAQLGPPIPHAPSQPAQEDLRV